MPLIVEKIISLLLAMLLMLSTGCGRKGGNSIRVDLSAKISSLDPQFTTSPLSRMILTNVMEGLTVENPNGTYSYGAAERHTVSRSGLTYTFVLREGLTWSDQQPLTANDFVFAFQRMFNTDVTSPYAEDYLFLKNASQILNGESDPSSLGVSAADDRTLIFTLEKPCANFFKLLADCSALPCNREFFENTRARYGLSKEYFRGNGAFYLSSWTEENLILKKNEQYWDAESVQTPAVYLYLNRNDPQQNFEKGKNDLYSVSAEQAEIYKQKGYSVLSQKNTVWCLTFNQGRDILAEYAVRQALLGSIDREALLSRLTGIDATDSYVAPNAAVDGQIYADLRRKVILPKYDPQTSAQLFAQGLQSLNLSSINGLEILLPESLNAGSFGGGLQRYWQDALRLYVNLEILPDEEFNKRVAAGNFDISLLPFTSDSIGPEGTLSCFISSDPRNIIKFFDSQYDEIMQQLMSESDPDAVINLSHRAEQYLADTATAIPVFCRADFYAVGKNVSGIELLADGRYLFKNAYRK